MVSLRNKNNEVEGFTILASTNENIDIAVNMLADGPSTINFVKYGSLLNEDLSNLLHLLRKSHLTALGGMANLNQSCHKLCRLEVFQLAKV